MIHILATATPPKGVSLLEAFFIQRHAETGELEVIGSLIIWGLLTLSALCTGLIIKVALSAKRADFSTPDRVKDFAKATSREELAAKVNGDASLLAQILKDTLDSGATGEAALHELDEASEVRTLERMRWVEPLSTAGHVAPMVGLFGTVYGMILAFAEIVSAGGAPDPVGLAAGIGTALTTTFWGLVVSIPSLTAASILRGRIDALALTAVRDAERVLRTSLGIRAS